MNNYPTTIRPMRMRLYGACCHWKTNDMLGPNAICCNFCDKEWKDGVENADVIFDHMKENHPEEWIMKQLEVL